MFKFLDPTGCTYRDGQAFRYNLAMPDANNPDVPQLRRYVTDWTVHPEPAAGPDGRACGSGRLHVMRRLDARYAPRNWWPWWVQEVRGEVGADDEKVAVIALRLRLIEPRVFHRALRLGWGKEADLRWADLSGADLNGADLSRADLRGADLSRASLSRANLSGAILSAADPSAAALSRADLRWADLSGADLRKTDLRWADLRGSVLCCADLNGTDLEGADLRGANLLEAVLSGANLNGARLDSGYALIQDHLEAPR